MRMERLLLIKTNWILFSYKYLQLITVHKQLICALTNIPRKYLIWAYNGRSSPGMVGPMPDVWS